MAPRKKKAKIGRPKLDDPRVTLSVRLNTEEREGIRTKAAEFGIPETTWARMALRRALGLTQKEL